MMTDFLSGSVEPTVICLGYFDSVHIGHIRLIERGKELSKKLNCSLSVFTLKGENLRSGGDVFTFEERLLRFKTQDIKNVIFADFTEEFKNKSAEEFLNELTDRFYVKGVVCGFDYTFGRGRQGNAEYLREYLKFKNIPLEVVDEVSSEGKKISTSLIKELLRAGKIEKANELLGGNYFVTSTVEEGKKLGRAIGFPTLNMRYGDGKMPIKEGVYLTLVIIDGKLHSSITNVGSQPTVGGDKVVIETYINDFNGDLYGKRVTVYFVSYIRDTVKFDSVEKLKLQLEKDKELLV